MSVGNHVALRQPRAGVVTPLATEAQYTNTIVEAAKLGGWLVYHGLPASTKKGHRTLLQGHKGFPDLILVHPVLGRVMVLEIKRRPNKATPEQLSWLLAFELAGIDARLVYVPEQLDALVAELVAPTIHPTSTEEP